MISTPLSHKRIKLNPRDHCSEYQRGRSISSILVPECSFHIGFKDVSTILGLTLGKLEERKPIFCQNKALYNIRFQYMRYQHLTKQVKLVIQHF